MDNIDDVLKNVMKKMSVQTPTQRMKLDQVWKEVLEDKDQKHTRLDGINNGKLTILVDSPAWLYQMKTKQKSILRNIQKQIPDIKSLSFKVGSFS